MTKKESDKFVPSTVFEGMVSIRAIISSYENTNSQKPVRKITKILYDANKINKKSKNARMLAYLTGKAKKYGFTLEASDEEYIESITIGDSHGGIVAFCEDKPLPELCAENISENGFYVMLEGIEDPYNFGYAVRSLYAAGVDGVILSPRNWMSAAGLVCRASAGASELVDIYICEQANVAEIFKSKGYKVICADTKNSVSAYETDLKRPIFLVIGGEKRGISKVLLQEATGIVHIDYGREFNASLSAASASSILSFEVMRQNMK